MLIQVASIHPPKIGGKVSKIVDADGQSYDIWPEKLTGIFVNQHYEIETSEREFNGRTFKSIKKIVPAPPAPTAAATAAEASPSSGEAEYVGRVLAALILKGEVTVNQVPAYTARLREVWRQI